MRRPGLACEPGCKCWENLPERTPERRSSYERHWARDNRDKTAANRRRYQERNPGAQRAAFLKHKHGMTLAQWDELWRRQCSCCYLCGEPLPVDDSLVHIDHDHRCCPPSRSCARCRRGLAHRDCNRMIGIAGEDPVKIGRIARELQRAQERLDL